MAVSNSKATKDLMPAQSQDILSINAGHRSFEKPQASSKNGTQKGTAPQGWPGTTPHTGAHTWQSALTTPYFFPDGCPTDASFSSRVLCFMYFPAFADWPRKGWQAPGWQAECWELRSYSLWVMRPQRPESQAGCRTLRTLPGRPRSMEHGC